MNSVIIASDLTKYYGARLAVDRVSFDVKQNEVLGLLGPNGSGKSTVLRILTGYLHPTSGSAAVAGYDIVSHSLEARSRIGYVPEDVPLYTQMRVTEFLEFMGRIRGLPAAALRSAVDTAIDRLSLGAVRQLMVSKLSRGYRQRLSIAQALLGKPQLLVLDEPTNGLDPRQIIEVRELIRELSKELSILVTSHILAEVERVAHRVAILLNGKLLTVHTLRAGQERFRVRLHPTADALSMRAAIDALPGVSVVEPLSIPGSYLIEDDAGSGAAVQKLVGAGFLVEEVSPLDSGLEALFLRLTEGAPR